MGIYTCTCTEYVLHYPYIAHSGSMSYLIVYTYCVNVVHVYFCWLQLTFGGYRNAYTCIKINKRKFAYIRYLCHGHVVPYKVIELLRASFTNVAQVDDGWTTAS